MRLDIKTEADRLADNPRISDYDFWRTLKNLENEIYRAAGAKEPIPFDIIRWRAIVREARHLRGYGAGYYE